MAAPSKKKSAQRPGAFSKGGSTRMFKRQVAGPDRPGNTGKDQSSAPSAKRAAGGEKTPRGVGGLSRAARPGNTGT